jgi:predicted GIY-YIG superfamily endonuclease
VPERVNLNTHWFYTVWPFIARYTRSHLPVALVWTRRVRSWSLALREERRIKALRKAEKEAMVR